MNSSTLLLPVAVYSRRRPPWGRRNVQTKYAVCWCSSNWSWSSLGSLLTVWSIVDDNQKIQLVLLEEINVYMLPRLRRPFPRVKSCLKQWLGHRSTNMTSTDPVLIAPTIPGHQKYPLARDFIQHIPWCSRCRSFNRRSRYTSGITTRKPYVKRMAATLDPQPLTAIHARWSHTRRLERGLS